MLFPIFFILFNFIYQQGACEGDEGSPNVCGYKIQGIVAHASKDTCQGGGFPTTVVDVGEHLAWIRHTVLELDEVNGIDSVNKNVAMSYVFLSTLLCLLL